MAPAAAGGPSGPELPPLEGNMFFDPVYGPAGAEYEQRARDETTNTPMSRRVQDTLNGISDSLNPTDHWAPVNRALDDLRSRAEEIYAGAGFSWWTRANYEAALTMGISSMDKLGAASASADPPSTTFSSYSPQQNQQAAIASGTQQAALEDRETRPVETATATAVEANTKADVGDPSPAAGDPSPVASTEAEPPVTEKEPEAAKPKPAPAPPKEAEKPKEPEKEPEKAPETPKKKGGFCCFGG